jgi:uncharacterized protein involved in outer membrane biogenesis
MKKAVKITLIGVATLVGAIIVALVLVPVLLEDRIIERLRTELNERLNATVTFSDVDASLLSTFPTLTAEISALKITGEGEFEGVTLVSAESVAAGVDLFALVMDDAIQIESIGIDHPEAHLIVTEDGKANYDIIAEPSEDPQGTTEESEDVAFEVERYWINEGVITYDEPGISVAAAGFTHEGSARISGSTQELESETTIEALTVKLGEITYLKGANTRIDVVATIETDQQHLQVDEIQIAVNQLAVNGSGGVGWSDEALDLDVKLASKKGLPIKALISAIPNAYGADFAGLKASGAFSLAAAIDGQLGPDDDDIPSVAVAANVRNGALKYPDLPLGITDLNLDAKLEHPGGNLDKMRISVPKYGIVAGRSHAEGSLSIARPLSQPNVDLTLNGRFDLAEVAKAYPVSDIDALAGLIDANIELSARGERIAKLTGNIEATDVVYQPAGAPAIEISAARVALSPQNTKIQELRAKVGESDVAIQGLASPLTTFLIDDQTITASASLKSNNLRVEDFLSNGEPAAEGAAAGQPSTLVLPENVDVKLQFDVRKLSYGDLVLRDFEGTGRIRNRRLILQGVRAKALGGTMKLDGTVTTSSDGPPTYDMGYAADKVSFAEAFQALPSMRAYAPIARFLDGRFSTDLKASGTLGDDLSPKLESIDAGGLVAALQSKLSSDFKPLGALNGAIPAIPKPLDIQNFKTRFKIEDGAVKVKTFPVQARGITMQVGGTHGLDQAMKYHVTTEVPLDGLSSKLAKEVTALGLDLSKAKTVGVRANLTGSIDAPRVSVDLDANALRGAVADTISAELAKQKARALKEVEQQTEKLIAEAQQRADQVRREATRAAEAARKEGYARAAQVEKEGEVNPLAKIAAREGARKIRQETDKRADQMIAEAGKRADQLVAEARKRAADMLAEAARRSDQGTEAAEQQTDRLR